MFAVELHGHGDGHERLAALARIAQDALGRSDPPIYRPHVSLGVFSVDADERAHACFAALAPRLRGMTLDMVSLGKFPPPPGVVYAAPGMSVELRAAHHAMLDAFAPLAPHLWPYYASAAWVPHVTLAMPASDEEQTRLFAALARPFVKHVFRVDEIGLVSVPDARVLAVAALGK